MSKKEGGIKNIWLILIVLIVILIVVPLLYPIFVPYMGVSHMQGMAYMMGWGVVYLLVFVLLIGLVVALAVSYTTRGTTGEVSSAPPSTNVEVRSEEKRDGLADLMRILTPEEKTVINLLIQNGGEMLQKDITRQLGFTRLKTHRILERMENRNLIKRIRIGNTNKVFLEDWVMEASKASGS